MNEQQPGVSVSMAAIIDQLHQRYGRLMAGMLQENAEIAAANDALSSRVAELESKVQALTPQSPSADFAAAFPRSRTIGGREVPGDAASIDELNRD